MRFVAAGVLLLCVGCASFMRWNAGKSTMTADCTGVDEITCNTTKTSSSFCCDGHAGWSCNPFGTPVDSKTPGRCEYTGDDAVDTPTWCGGPLGCEGVKRPRDAGAEQ